MRSDIDTCIKQISRVIKGKEKELELALVCLLANGHLLLEDLPGMGKTSLSHALAEVLGFDFARIQFTSDLLPADMLGVNIFENATQSFRFHAGPIFNQLILADEIESVTEPDIAARIMAGLPPIKEALHPNQQKIDVHEPEKDEITADDFKKLRAMKKGSNGKITKEDTDETTLKESGFKFS